MSDLSRLRAHWIRLERRISKLDAEMAKMDEDETATLMEKRLEASGRLTETMAKVHKEELRLMAPDAKLRFSND